MPKSFHLAMMLGLTLPVHAATSETVLSWLPGIWRMTHDEDKGPVGELIEFTATGDYYSYGRDCLSMKPIHFHVHDGNIYVTSVIMGKGPVSVVFHPIENHTKLTFTSPRTFKNATYMKTSLAHCER